MTARKRGSDPRKDNGLREQAEVGKTSSSNIASLAGMYEIVKGKLLAGKDVRLIDFESRQRAAVIGAVAALRDEYPVRTSWRTVRESHLSETRLRARTYWIPGEYFHD